MIYDSFDDPECAARIIIFGTVENLRQLMRCERWFLDGTFKVVPVIFFQLFVVMGSFSQRIRGTDVRQQLALPLVYALMEDKTEDSYTKILEMVYKHCHDHNTPTSIPALIMTDFELAIINSAKQINDEQVRGCFFHLCQSVYRYIQSVGLQREYNKPGSKIKEASHMMCALAFIPTEFVNDKFLLLSKSVPQDFNEVMTYFDVSLTTLIYKLRIIN